MRLVDESIDDFLEKFNLVDSQTTCVKCDKKAKFNKVWYQNGLAIAQFQHECPQQYWTTAVIPIGLEEKEFWGTLLSIGEL